MRISLKWINQYVDVSDYLKNPAPLAAKLTSAGIEVENIECRAGDYEGVVVGEILEKTKHPDADRLTVCQVATRVGVVHQIVCGATNHQAGDRVAVALPGTVLPGDFKIKKSKIRGVNSEGMLCSEKELALRDESQGIMILPKDAPLGQPLATYLELDDVGLELKVTPNRSDCLSHFGLAREIALLLGRNLLWTPPTRESVAKSETDFFKVEVRAPELCPRYSGRLISGVKVLESPKWLKKRLESVGLNSINNIVDITNFVMMELGQPLHAFDKRFVHGNMIVVERSRAAERFTTLDGTEINLDGGELVIRDQERPIALAGVVGGLNSGIQQDTTEIFVESAYFLPSSVRKTARRHGIETDSAYRFARGVDPEAAIRSLDRACSLIIEIAGGAYVGESIDFYPNVFPRKFIEASSSRIGKLLGYKVAESDFTNWMLRLGCEVKPVGNDQYSIVPPPYRGDLQMDVDLAEEFARLHGYEHIPEALPVMKHWPNDDDPKYLEQNLVAQHLSRLGYRQAVNTIMTSSESQLRVHSFGDILREFGVGWEGETVRLANPLSEEANVLRHSLVPALWGNCLHNYRNGLAQGRLFEVGTVFENQNGRYREERRVAMISWGENQGLWMDPKRIPPVLAMKSDVLGFLNSLNIKNIQWRQNTTFPDFLHPGKSAIITCNGKSVGFLGNLHPGILEESKVRCDVVVCEINLEKIVSDWQVTLKASTFSRYPSVERDLAFVMAKDLAANEVYSTIVSVGGEFLREALIFDYYEGEQLGQGKKSLAFRLTFQGTEGTLTDVQINELQEKITQEVCTRHGITLR